MQFILKRRIGRIYIVSDASLPVEVSPLRQFGVLWGRCLSLLWHFLGFYVSGQQLVFAVEGIRWSTFSLGLLVGLRWSFRCSEELVLIQRLFSIRWS